MHLIENTLAEKFVNHKNTNQWFAGKWEKFLLFSDTGYILVTHWPKSTAKNVLGMKIF